MTILLSKSNKKKIKYSIYVDIFTFKVDWYASINSRWMKYANWMMLFEEFEFGSKLQYTFYSNGSRIENDTMTHNNFKTKRKRKTRTETLQWQVKSRRYNRITIYYNDFLFLCRFVFTMWHTLLIRYLGN